VVIDTLRADYLPVYGHSTMNSPFLTQLSKKSVVFENTFSASSWTTPGTASIFTALYPFQHGTLIGFKANLNKLKKENSKIRINRIPEEISTVAEMLKERGYATFGIADNINICKDQGFTQGFDQFKTLSYRRARRINKVLKRWRNKIENNQKYFLYIHFMDPHLPHKTKDHELSDYIPDVKSFTTYDREIAYVDAHFKELYNLFNWDKDTLVIITSDHGEGFMEHGTYGHGHSLYLEEIRVPLIFKMPNENSGTRVKGNFSTVDILPTLGEFVGLSRDKDLAGISLIPFIQNKNHTIPERYIYSHLLCTVGKDIKKKGIDWKATIFKNWHYIYKTPVKKEEMYDFKADAREIDNLVRKNIKISWKLKKELMKFLKNCKKYKRQEIDYHLKKKRNQELKTLGYF
jgi:arylsulfatase A-like enzyme